MNLSGLEVTGIITAALQTALEDLVEYDVRSALEETGNRLAALYVARRPDWDGSAPLVETELTGDVLNVRITYRGRPDPGLIPITILPYLG
jgi:hypothetical protein